MDPVVSGQWSVVSKARIWSTENQTEPQRHREHGEDLGKEVLGHGFTRIWQITWPTSSVANGVVEELRVGNVKFCILSGLEKSFELLRKAIVGDRKPNQFSRLGAGRRIVVSRKIFRVARFQSAAADGT